MTSTTTPYNDILFDLDGTLYPHECGLTDALGARMASYVHQRMGLPPEEARQLCDDMYARYGLTVSGLRAEHGVDADDYLAFVHAIDYAGFLAHSPLLAERLGGLRARKSVFTNAPGDHARVVLNLLGLNRHFARVFDLEFCDWLPKPQIATYRRVMAALRSQPGQTIMVEDSARNLPPAQSLGMTTIWIGEGAKPEGADYAAATLDEALDIIEDLLC